MRRTTRSTSNNTHLPANINKPFKSPIIRDGSKKPTSSTTKAQKSIGLLDDIEDSDSDSALDLEFAVDQSSRFDNKDQSPEIESQVTSTSAKGITQLDEIQDEENENQPHVKREASRKFYGQKGKFMKKSDKEMTKYMEDRSREKLEAEEKRRKRDAEEMEKFTFKPPPILGDWKEKGVVPISAPLLWYALRINT
ncbi:hypothetical protein ABW19_dt0204463 [Dactylella cylindrospora]|nr:hypothetical protein ABW19_dt0204463 [Dactylella cylindrospora]